MLTYSNYSVACSNTSNAGRHLIVITCVCICSVGVVSLQQCCIMMKKGGNMCVISILCNLESHFLNSPK